MTQSNTVVDVRSTIQGQQFNFFRAAIVGWAFLIMAIEGYNMQVVGYAAPSIIKAWHLNKASFAWVFSIGLFGYLLGAIVLSNLSDRIGRKAVVVCGALLFGAFTIACARTSTLINLEILRFIAGAGLGVSIPTIIALTVEFAPTRARATTVGVTFIGYNAGAALGGFIAAKLMPVYGWQSAFYVGGFAPLVIGLVFVVALPESVGFLALKQARPDRVAAILAKIRPDMAFDRNARFVLREEKHPGLPVKRLFTDGRAMMTSLLWAAYIASLIGHQFMTSWLPTVLNSSGMSLSRAVMAAALFQAGGGVGAVLVCWCLDKRGITAVAASFGIATFLTIMVGFAGSSDALMMGIVFVNGICMLGGQVGLNALSGTIYPTYIRSTGAGWAFGVGRIGSILGPVMGGILISMNPSKALLFTYAAIPVLVCAGATFLLKRAAERFRVFMVEEEVVTPHGRTDHEVGAR